VVAILLLLACANVAGLVLARSAARRKEIGIRLALGASHGQLVRQLPTESILLAFLAGGIGLCFSIFLTRSIQWFQPAMDMPLRFHVELDHSVVGFTLLVSMLSGILCGFAPALQASRPDLVTVLKETGSSEGVKPLRFRNVLVVGQLALSMMLLAAAGLAVRSLQSINIINPGFDPEHQAVASVDLELQGYDRAAVMRFVEELRSRLRLLPGVQAVGFGQVIPLTLSAQQTGFRPEGYVQPPDQPNPGAEYNIVDPGYFPAMGIRILRGRAFSDRDDRRAPHVVIVNETAARRFWLGRNPIGKRAWVGIGGSDFEVVGVVPDGKYLTLGEAPKPCIYLPLYQIHTGELNVHVRTSADPAAVLEPIRRQVAALDPTLPVFNLKTMSDHLDFALLPARLVAGTVSAFAFLALLLAAVGLYGVMAYSVNQRVREIGIRIALGATRQDVLKLVVGRGMLLSMMGLAIGTAAGLLLTPAMSGLLYGVSATDPVSHTGAIAVLAVTGLVASYLPALKATRVDPIKTLRAE
jgi:putative ABC transport system permease protein